MTIANTWLGFSPEESGALNQATRIRRRAVRPSRPTWQSLDESGIFTTEELNQAARFEGRSLTTVLSLRRSRTHELGAVLREDLSRLLWHSGRLVGYGTNNEGAWQTRPYPSAGGTHSITLYVDVAAAMGVPAGLYRFNAASCQLSPARMDAEELSGLRTAIRNAARREQNAPVTVLLLADASRLAERYEAPLTLLMRDAGACAATIQLVATDLGLASSIIGVAGQALTQSAGPMVCCGAVVIGALDEHSVS